MLIATTLEDLGHARDDLGRGGRTVALVPTMGALHEGHLSLVSIARDVADSVVASIFVNPLQFGPNEDLDHYPRDEAGDLEKLRAQGCDLVWMPSPDIMYPADATTRIIVGGPSKGFEGDSRPGHFEGVATVCAKLFHQTRADAAIFGEKDWQQLQVIRRMVTDLNFPVRIIGGPTVRESDGLACSSRNRRLSAEQRKDAAAFPASLRAMIAALETGETPNLARRKAWATLETAGFEPDYLALVDPSSLTYWPDGKGGDARLLAAARIGDVRLLDNMPVRMPD